MAGWYADPENPQMARYWDGSQWTDDRRPLVSNVEVSGWLLFFGYAGAIFLPIVGLIIGIVLLVKKATGHGVAVLAISIAIFALGFAITTGEDRDAGRSGGRSVEERLHRSPLVLSVRPTGKRHRPASCVDSSPSFAHLQGV